MPQFSYVKNEDIVNTSPIILGKNKNNKKVY